MEDSSPQPDRLESAVQGGAHPRFGEVRIRRRGRLPHWEKDGGLYFVTFHLADSLPRAVLDRIKERQRILEAARRAGANLSPRQKVIVEEFRSKNIEEYFDRGIGACFLGNPEIGDLIANALRFWHGKRYRLVAWCVMPNHVHVIFRLFPGQELAVVIRSWKLFTARKANRFLGRSGVFWQREYYDRLIREDGELDRAILYVLTNPERAGLANWRWRWCAGMDTRTTAGLETGATVLDPAESSNG